MGCTAVQGAGRRLALCAQHTIDDRGLGVPRVPSVCDVVWSFAVIRGRYRELTMAAAPARLCMPAGSVRLAVCEVHMHMFSAHVFCRL